MNDKIYVEVLRIAPIRELIGELIGGFIGGLD